MMKPITASFLGTSSGGGPTEKRSCSSLVLDISGGEELWMVDCGEGTLRQFQQRRLGLKPGKIRKIFITHIHLDHCIGIPTLLGNLLRGQLQEKPDPAIRSRPPKIELFGPAGLRALVRTILTMTSTVVNEPYAVHELLTTTDSLTPSEHNHLHPGEIRGRDIRCGDDGLWRGFLHSRFGNVDAGPIEHRAPCIGYVFTTHSSALQPEHSRKIVVLGDTCDPSAIVPLALEADLLIHEATDASIPSTVDAKAKENKRTPIFVETQAKQRGHSTPSMAGEFAKSIRAKQLILNHIGARFPPADGHNTRNTRIIREIERQASVSSGLAPHAVRAAYDFLVIPITIAVPHIDQKLYSNPSSIGSSNGKHRERDDRASSQHRSKRAKR